MKPITHDTRKSGVPAHPPGAQFQCQDCGAVKPIRREGGTGYGVFDGGAVICYSCCAVRAKADMIATGRAILYLCGNARDGWKVTDWPGKLTIRPESVRRFAHPFARYALLAHFTGPDGKRWSGRNIGDSQILHARRLSC